MRLIVGLGNPGKSYIKTRHNVGFHLLDAIARDRGVEINKKKFSGLYGIDKSSKDPLIFLKPQAYMNNSGQVVKKFVDYYDIKTENILIIYDDNHLEVGNYKLKAQGSSGGHKGLKSIEQHLQTEEYKRIKIGIGRDMQMLTSDYVLGKFSTAQWAEIKDLELKIIAIFTDYLKYDFDKVMNLHNQKNTL